MPNLVNRRRKKSKIVEPQMTLRSDSTESDYEFSSKLNYKYNVLPEKTKSSHRHKSEAEKQEAFEIRYENRLYGCVIRHTLFVNDTFLYSRDFFLLLDFWDLNAFIFLNGCIFYWIP